MGHRGGFRVFSPKPDQSKPFFAGAPFLGPSVPPAPLESEEKLGSEIRTPASESGHQSQAPAWPPASAGPVTSVSLLYDWE